MKNMSFLSRVSILILAVTLLCGTTISSCFGSLIQYNSFDTQNDAGVIAFIQSQGIVGGGGILTSNGFGTNTSFYGTSTFTGTVVGLQSTNITGLMPIQYALAVNTNFPVNSAISNKVIVFDWRGNGTNQYGALQPTNTVVSIDPPTGNTVTPGTLAAGATTITGAAGVSGAVTAGSISTSGTLAAGATTVTGTLNASGNITAGAGAKFAGDASLTTNAPLSTVTISNNAVSIFNFTNTQPNPVGLVSNNLVVVGTNNTLQIKYSSGTAGIQTNAEVLIYGIQGLSTIPQGYIGETLTAGVGSGSAVSLTTATTANVTSLAIPVGEWDIDWVVEFQAAATTSLTAIQAGVSSTTATLPVLTAATPVAYFSDAWAAMVPAQATIPITATSGTTHLSLNAATTYFLTARGTFTVSTMTAYGWIRAVRTH